MRVNPISSEPFVYNTNYVNATSLNKVRAIPNDVNAGKTDYSEMVGKENTNPLRPGESADYEAIVESQMSMSRQNAERVLQNREEEATAESRRPVREERDAVAQAGMAGAEATEEAAARYDVAAEEAALVSAPSEEASTSRVIVAEEEGVVSRAGNAREENVQLENYELQTGAPGKEMVGESVFANVVPDGLTRPEAGSAGDAETAVIAASATAASAINIAEDSAGAETAEVSQSSVGANQAAAESNQPSPYEMRRATDAYMVTLGLAS